MKKSRGVKRRNRGGRCMKRNRMRKVEYEAPERKEAEGEEKRNTRDKKRKQEGENGIKKGEDKIDKRRKKGRKGIEGA